MDAIFNYLQENRMVLIVMLGLIAWGFHRLTAKPAAETKDRGLAPGPVRINRRESERGDRRMSHALAFNGVERRHGGRRG